METCFAPNLSTDISSLMILVNFDIAFYNRYQSVIIYSSICLYSHIHVKGIIIISVFADSIVMIINTYCVSLATYNYF